MESDLWNIGWFKPLKINKFGGLKLRLGLSNEIRPELTSFGIFTPVFVELQTLKF
jgi:hypothetical protein